MGPRSAEHGGGSRQSDQNRVPDGTGTEMEAAAERAVCQPGEGTDPRKPEEQHVGKAGRGMDAAESRAWLPFSQGASVLGLWHLTRAQEIWLRYSLSVQSRAGYFQSLEPSHLEG